MRQCFAWWSFTLGREDLDPAVLLRGAADVGMEGVEMVPEQLWSTVRDAGLQLVSITAHDIEVGFNDRRNHAACSDQVSRAIQTASSQAIPLVLVFAGNRSDGIDDAAAIDHCAEGLAPLADEADRGGVTLVLELLNSKVDHPGYQCDTSDFGLDVVRRVGSPGLRVLFDAYHMQLMEGDLSRTIKAGIDLIGHVHTAGVPGRRDLDDRQEINWRAIAGLLRHVSYDAWVGHELIPRGDPIAALRAAHDLFTDPASRR